MGMNGVAGVPEIGRLITKTVNNGTFSPDHYAGRISDRLLSISETCPEPLRQQAEAYKAEIYRTVKHYVGQAITEERDYNAHLAEQHGHTDTAEAIRNR